MRGAIRIGTTRHSNERRDPADAEPLSDVGPSSTVVGLDEQELAVLREVGGHWERVLRGRREWLRALPVDPGLHRFPSSPVAGRGARLAEVDFVASDEAGEAVVFPVDAAVTGRTRLVRPLPRRGRLRAGDRASRSR